MSDIRCFPDFGHQHEHEGNQANGQARVRTRDEERDPAVAEDAVPYSDPTLAYEESVSDPGHRGPHRAIHLLTSPHKEKISIQEHHEHRYIAAPDHPRRPRYDLGMLGVLLHIIGDAINNIGVIIAALVLWKSTSDARFYADPAISLFIAVMIFASAFPLVKGAGSILLEAAPLGIDMEDIKRDLEKASYIPRRP